MKRNKIIINNGVVTIPSNPIMTDFEIAELFGVLIRTIKDNIKSILKAGICNGDYQHGGTVSGLTVLPDYYGLDMITALSFRVDSPEARLFRNHIIRKLAPSKPLLIQMPKNATIN